MLNSRTSSSGSQFHQILSVSDKKFPIYLGTAAAAAAAAKPMAGYAPLGSLELLALALPTVAAAEAVHTRMLFWSCLMSMGLGM